jgi:tetratricopeptide (TPR) repeat protein
MRWFFVLLAVVCLGSACRPTKVAQEQRSEPTVAMSESYALVWRDDSAPTETTPVSLTAADGTGLEMRELRVRGVVDDPLAFTELRMTFHNPEDRQREGRFEIELPPGAVVSRLSMKIAGEWQEAEMVERQQARVVYESFLHQRRDPALLEVDAGNRFRARIFPIPPRADKEIILSYTQELRHSAEPYRVALKGLPKMRRLDVDVAVHEPGRETPEHLRFDLHDVAPEHDVEVSMPDRDASVGLRHHNLVLARVQIAADAEPDPVTGLTVLFDTSASRGPGLRTQVERLAEVVHGIQTSQGADFDLSVIAFDQEIEPVYEGTAAGFDGFAQGRIVARGALGASDLEQALAFVRTSGLPHDRVLLVGDGIATAGTTDPAVLAGSVTALARANVRRFDVLVTGTLRDEGVLDRLVSSHLGQAGAVVDGSLTAPAMIGKLTHRAYARAKVEVPGARWVWPAHLEAVQPGDQRLVFADLPEGTAMEVKLEGVDLESEQVELRQTERPLLERAWIGAEIARLHANGQSSKERILELSKRHRVMSPYTALLVLETDADYDRFGLDRRALADVLTVGAGGVEVLRRTSPAPEPTYDPTEMAISFGGFRVQVDEDEEDDEAGGTGQRHKGEEGKMGKPTSRQKSGLYSMKAPGDGGVIPQMARNFDPDMTARQAGILGIQAQQGGHFLSSPYGGGFAVGNDDDDVWGGLKAGEGVIGLGNLGLIGQGSGTGSGYGRGSGTGFGGRGRRVPRVRQAKAEVKGALDKDIVRRIVRAHVNEVRHCYNQGLARNPNLKGRVYTQFVIGATGKVRSSVTGQSTVEDKNVGRCIAKAAKRWKFPKPKGGGNVIVTMPFVLDPGGNGPAVTIPEPPARRQIRRSSKRTMSVGTGKPHEGRYAEVRTMIDGNEERRAARVARKWHAEAPQDVLAVLALGEALEATGDLRQAARAYGSLIDLFPSRAEMRRLAGERLLALDELGLSLALDTFAQAVKQRSDHPSSHRLHALALAKAGHYPDAFAALERGLKAEHVADRFPGVRRVLREDLGLIAAAWKHARPQDTDEIQARLREAGARMSTKRSTRFVLHWESDRADLDLHVFDGKEHASYKYMGLQSGGELFADVRNGFGPEAFVIRGKAKASYRLQAILHDRGPSGYAMGALQILIHDGHGKLEFEERPFVIQTAGGRAELGQFRAS